MVVCEWCLINVHHDVALHSARLLNNFDDIKKAYTGTKNINMANKPRVLLGSSNKRLGPWQYAKSEEDTNLTVRFWFCAVHPKSIFSYKVYP